MLEITSCYLTQTHTRTHTQNIYIYKGGEVLAHRFSGTSSAIVDTDLFWIACMHSEVQGEEKVLVVFCLGMFIIIFFLVF